MTKDGREKAKAKIRELSGQSVRIRLVPVQFGGRTLMAVEQVEEDRAAVLARLRRQCQRGLPDPGPEGGMEEPSAQPEGDVGRKGRDLEEEWAPLPGEEFLEGMAADLEEMSGRLCGMYPSRSLLEAFVKHREDHGWQWAWKELWRVMEEKGWELLRQGWLQEEAAFPQDKSMKWVLEVVSDKTQCEGMFLQRGFLMDGTTEEG